MPTRSELDPRRITGGFNFHSGLDNPNSVISKASGNLLTLVDESIKDPRIIEVISDIVVINSIWVNNVPPENSSTGLEGYSNDEINRVLSERKKAKLRTVESFSSVEKNDNERDENSGEETEVNFLIFSCLYCEEVFEMKVENRPKRIKTVIWHGICPCCTVKENLKNEAKMKEIRLRTQQRQMKEQKEVWERIEGEFIEQAS